ncbi:MAG: hypothetical protein CUN53_00075 [Phototrophicales bacterium]|nr:MAG: hypothetical protein CUN53_00075 [Phototrophicales bacterium]
MPRHKITPEERAKWPRRRCDNCGNFYHKNPEREDHRHCSDRCRIEFSRNGSPLVRLRERIRKEVAGATRAQLADLARRLDDMERQLKQLMTTRPE